MYYIPFLLAGGLVLPLAFAFCYSNTCAPCCGLCLTKFGCLAIQGCVMLTLIYSFVFLGLGQFYNDVCLVALEPTEFLTYVGDNYGSELKSLFEGESGGLTTANTSLVDIDL